MNDGTLHKVLQTTGFEYSSDKVASKDANNGLEEISNPKDD
jgi:hypothetical protein